ncbi:MAG: response regulator transcription factor [Actinobacteria bacterium]|nr:response regulator transcription factor [Actinomycetota bacterium]
MHRRPAPAATAVLLVADVSLWREALVAHLDQRDDVALVGCGELADAATRAAAVQAPVAIVDAQHATSDPAVAIRAVRSASPLTRCVAVVGGGGPAEHGRMLEAGATNVIGAAGSLSHLASAIVAARDGRTTLDPATQRKLQQAWHTRRTWEQERDAIRARLSRREMEVLADLAGGHDQRQIAQRLGISPATVRTHIRNLLGKLGATSRLQAVAVALRYGIIRAPRSRRAA